MNGTDIDSPLSTLVGVIRSIPSENRGSLHRCIYNAPLNKCDIGAQLAAFETIDQISPGTAQWRVVYQPQTTKGKVAVSFYIVDDYVAVSTVYAPTVRVKSVNRPPVINVTQVYSAVQGDVITLTNTSVADPDAGNVPINLVARVQDEGLKLELTSGSSKKDCIVSADSRVINCTGKQSDIKKYFSKMTINTNSSSAGTHTVTFTVDDNGAGAEVEERSFSHLTATTSITIELANRVVPVAPVQNNLTAAIAAGSVGGAVGAAAAVAAVAKLVKKPDNDIFGNMLDFDNAGVVDNPLYVQNNGEVDNPLYEAS